MKFPKSLSLILAITTGLLFGWQARVNVRGSSPERSSPPRASPAERKDHRQAASGKATARSPEQSTEVASAIHALPTEDLYERMALFLLGAEAGEFPAFYAEFQNRPDRTRDLNDLLFIAWTRVDPEAAIAATRDTEDFQYVHWAWACHDPAAALAAAVDRNEGLADAARGIGEFHPQWLVEHFELIPEEARDPAIQGLTKWPDTETPETTVTFLSDHFQQYLFEIKDPTLLAFAREDPAQAYAFLKERTVGIENYQSRQSQKLLEQFMDTVSRHDPSLLVEMADTAKNPVDGNRLRNTCQAGNTCQETHAETHARQELRAIDHNQLIFSFYYWEHMLLGVAQV